MIPPALVVLYIMSSSTLFQAISPLIVSSFDFDSCLAYSCMLQLLCERNGSNLSSSPPISDGLHLALNVQRVNLRNQCMFAIPEKASTWDPNRSKHLQSF
ncbi:hypothetical protein K474DRAFT_1203824 [Panus rudis PR-1116 ss-1]|nr:hypothetical protein K474DRAFT_1203824 [Panus rudis PR-1116 ss-1]